MNDKIAYLHQQIAPGTLTVFVCGCKPDAPAAFLPIVAVQNPPLVVGFMCPKCEQRLDVMNGAIQEKTNGG